MDYGVVITGVLTLVLGQAILRFVLKPIQNFNRERGDMAFLLIYFSSAEVDRSKRTQDDDYNLGLIGASLVSCIAQIPFYNILSLLPILGLPRAPDVLKAATLSVDVEAEIRKESPKKIDTTINGKLLVIAKLLKTSIPQPVRRIRAA